MKTTSAYTLEEQAANRAKWESLPKRKPLPCNHLGDELRAGAIAGMGLNPRKRWRLCNAGKVAAVCICSGGDPRCGPKCSGYESSQSTLDGKGTMEEREAA